ncbi:glutaredoxin family protein [Solemya elarraichensis gill symbiont]|uniref:glutaredoxin family protein n=1 Tax=Solemya elarraichensis gill symbiont TaxID=1918949 RepID=UPI0009973CC3|nr:glutaredoxin family protein [Solemya elarraichensis gill symbiont]
MIRLEFYCREGCHLCEAMWHELGDYRSRDDLEFSCIDISRDESLETRYGEMIPVLAHGERVICNYFLDPELLDVFLANPD